MRPLSTGLRSLRAAALGVLLAPLIMLGVQAQPASAQPAGAQAWGLNASGQLGNGTNTNSNIPVTTIGLTGNESTIAAGSNHSLAA